MNEVFKDIVGYEGYYQISNYGNVKSLSRFYSRKERFLKKYLATCGYFTVGLCKGNNSSLVLIHRLVALTFIPNPENKATVNHKDGNKLNNNVSNLEWNTHAENVLHAYTIGLKTSLYCKGEKNYRAKLTEKDVLRIRELAKTKIFSQSHIAKIYNCGKVNISDIVNRKRWKHI